MANKSESDSAFARDAENFVAYLQREPNHYGFERQSVDALAKATADFRRKLSAAQQKHTRSKQTCLDKDDARRELDRMIRRYRNLLRVDDSLSEGQRLILRVPARPTKLRRTKCPRTRPCGTYIGATHRDENGRKKHILRFKSDPNSRSTAKPPGAVRLELFYDHIAKGEPVPMHPGELSGGRLYYLGSFTRTTIEAEFPATDTPMIVLYWARWAGANCDVGPFSQTIVADVECAGVNVKALPDRTMVRRRQQNIVITTARPQLPDPADGVEAIDTVRAGRQSLLEQLIYSGEPCPAMAESIQK